MESQVLAQLLVATDTAIALVTALWLLSSGLKRFDQIQANKDAFTDKMFAKFEQQNNRLMEIVERKCADANPLGGKT